MSAAGRLAAVIELFGGIDPVTGDYRPALISMAEAKKLLDFPELPHGDPMRDLRACGCAVCMEVLTGGRPPRRLAEDMSDALDAVRYSIACDHPSFFIKLRGLDLGEPVFDEALPSSTCDCGGAKANTTHSHWCSSKDEQ